VRISDKKTFQFNKTKLELIRRLRTGIYGKDISEWHLLRSIERACPYNPHGRPIEPREYRVLQKLCCTYWRGMLKSENLPMSCGEFLSNAPRGCGQILYKKSANHIERIYYQGQEGANGRRVLAANFRIGKFNEGIISSPGAAPDTFDEESDYPVRKKHEENIEQSMPAEYENSDAIVPILYEHSATLICKCGTHEQRILRVPTDVQIQGEMGFSCKKCNDKDARNSRHEMARPVVVRAVLNPRFLPDASLVA